MKTLKDAKIGETVQAVKVHGEGPIKRRIMDMGITKGVRIYVRKVAPLGANLDFATSASAVKAAASLTASSASIFLLI